MKALTVDDSKVVRMVARKILESLKFTVMEAEDGQVALDVCKDNKFDIILLDWNMPVMDGMEFLVEFRKTTPSSETKIVFCTTENDMSNIMAAITSGADEYIMKPFDENIVSGKLSQLGII